MFLYVCVSNMIHCYFIIRTIIPELIKLVEPRRPLNPRRTERKKVTAQNLQALDVRILINVTRAVDIPVRQDSLTR